MEEKRPVYENVSWCQGLHCAKSVRIRSFSVPYFPALLNTERYGVFLSIQSECEKKRTRKTPNTDTIQVVLLMEIILGGIYSVNLYIGLGQKVNNVD